LQDSAMEFTAPKNVAGAPEARPNR
jgi:hypothetical protein